MGCFNAGFAYSFLAGNMTGTAMVFVVSAAFCFHCVLSSHDGVAAFPIFMRRQ